MPTKPKSPETFHRMLAAHMLNAEPPAAPSAIPLMRVGRFILVTLALILLSLAILHATGLLAISKGSTKI